MAKLDWKARIVSESNFPLSAGIASSASGFAALTLAAVHAAGLDLPQKELSRIARRGSGSATRSIYGGFVEFLAGDTDSDSYAVPIAPADHWDLVDLIAIVEKEPKSIGSSAGHSLAPTSPLQASRIADTPRRLQLCREAILTRNFAQLFSIVEQDSNLMHAVMMTSTPPLIYWAPNTIAIMKSVASWRKSNLKVCYTIDAGPNVHSICMRKDAQEVRKRLQHIPGVSSVLISKPGGPARIIAE
jgi:diphosphomevalonate decarboxylase